MRETARLIAQAFQKGKAKTVGNTSTDGETVFLWGHAIVKREQGAILVSLANHPSATTRSRINNVLEYILGPERPVVYQSKFEQYIAFHRPGTTQRTPRKDRWDISPMPWTGWVVVAPIEQVVAHIMEGLS